MFQLRRPTSFLSARAHPQNTRGRARTPNVRIAKNVRVGVVRGRGFQNVRGGVDPGDNHFRLRFVGVADVWNIFHPGNRSLSSRRVAEPRSYPSHTTMGHRDFGFHTMRGGINSGERRLRSRYVGVVMSKGIYDPGMIHYPSRVALTTSANQ